MSKKQLNTFDIISKANAGYITVKEAAESLGLSERQVQRLKKKVREMGAAGVLHKNSFKSPVNKIPTDVVEKIIALKRSDLYACANFSHFRELLSERHGIEISYAAHINIISLNASIEAARAGQHGKTFAVVADEIRRLAASSKETVAKTDKISSQANAAVKEMNASMEEIYTAVDAAYTNISVIIEGGE